MYKSPTGLDGLNLKLKQYKKKYHDLKETQGLTLQKYFPPEEQY
ncbi:hypothetical protein PPE_06515 [Paenibacillus polymyxa E681]|nr:hypothetical protein PPE_06515 [Paenibacillus polymyxa E681]